MQSYTRIKTTLTALALLIYMSLLLPASSISFDPDGNYTYTYPPYSYPYSNSSQNPDSDDRIRDETPQSTITEDEIKKILNLDLFTTIEELIAKQDFRDLQTAQQFMNLKQRRSNIVSKQIDLNKFIQTKKTSAAEAMISARRKLFDLNQAEYTLYRIGMDIDQIKREIQTAQTPMIKKSDTVDTKQSQNSDAQEDSIENAPMYPVNPLELPQKLQANLDFLLNSEAKQRDLIKEKQQQLRSYLQTYSNDTKSIEIADLISTELNYQLTLADEKISQLTGFEDSKNSFKFYMSIVFAVLVGIVIAGFFSIAILDGNVRATIFSGGAGIQFVTLFSLVIAIILFGIVGILEGKELAALLGGLSGYILGRGTSDGSKGNGSNTNGTIAPTK